MAAKALAAIRRYPRGEETRQRVVDAAIEIFGRQGFAGTSTRDIAAAADVSTPAIQYYFGGKLGLYRAGIDQLTAAFARRIAPAMLACRASVADGASLDEVTAALSRVQDCLIDSFLTGPQGDAIRRLLAWENAENSEDLSDHLMRDRIGLPIFETFRQVVAHIAAAAIPQAELDMHALSLIRISMIVPGARLRGLPNCPLPDAGLLPALKTVAHGQLRYVLAGLSHARLSAMTASGNTGGPRRRAGAASSIGGTE